MASTSARAIRDLWGPIGQIGYVVSDLGTATRQWTASVGLGPWHIFDPAPFDAFRYEGQPSEAVVGFALAFMGDVQIELIQQHNDAPSMYREMLDSYGEGAQHICFYPEDYEAALQAGIESGMSVGQDGEIWGIDFAYLRGDGGRVIELADLGAERRANRQVAIEAAAVWDGTDPFCHH